MDVGHDVHMEVRIGVAVPDSLTKVPIPCRFSMRPPTWSAARALRMVVRETLNMPRKIVLVLQHGADVVAARQDAVAQHQEHLPTQRIAKLPADRNGLGQRAMTGSSFVRPLLPSSYTDCADHDPIIVESDHGLDITFGA